MSVDDTHTHHTRTEPELVTHALVLLLLLLLLQRKAECSQCCTCLCNQHGGLCCTAIGPVRKTRPYTQMKGTLTSEMNVIARNKMKDLAGKLNSQDHKSPQDEVWASSRAGASEGTTPYLVRQLKEVQRINRYQKSTIRPSVPSTIYSTNQLTALHDVPWVVNQTKAQALCVLAVTGERALDGRREEGVEEGRGAEPVK